jgi:hypothetical protein
MNIIVSINRQRRERGDCGENEKIYSLELIDYDLHHWGASSYIL